MDDELVKRLRHLVSLNEPENGGPYGGIAAQECMKAMAEAADRIEALTQGSSHHEIRDLGEFVAERKGKE